MSSLLLTSLVLMAPPAPLEAPPVSTLAPDLSVEELRDAFRVGIRASYQGEPDAAVPKLVRAYKALDWDKKLSNSEREKLKFRLRSRMIYMGDRIVARARTALRKREREEALAKRRGAQNQTTDHRKPAGQTVAAAGGAAEADNAEALIDLIRNTIKPESWDDAGGPGSIVYYQPLKVLVIRQTQEVHWLIGGLGGALRKGR